MGEAGCAAEEEEEEKKWRGGGESMSECQFCVWVSFEHMWNDRRRDSSPE